MKIYYLSNTSFSDCDINLLHHLSKKYEITYGLLFPQHNANFSEEYLMSYCEVSNIKKDFFHFKYRLRDPRTINTYFKIIKSIFQKKPDLIYINNFDHIYLNLLLLFLDNRKIIVAIHDVENHSGTSFAWVAKLSRSLLLIKFNIFLTFSKSQLEALKAIKPKKRIYMIPLCLKDFGPSSLLKRDRSIISFLFFGNIKPYKGLDILLNSINRLSKKYSNFSLTIAGRCSKWKEVYEPLLKNQHLINKQIRFIENHEIPLFFSNADYLILPYRDSTQSGPLMIAYNYNVPVLASDIPGLNEFMSEGKSGYLFNPNYNQSIDKVLEDALNRDIKNYDILCKNLIQYKQKNHSIESTINHYTKLFDTVGKEIFNHVNNF